MLLFAETGKSEHQSRKFRSPAAAILVLGWVALFQAACLFHAASPSTGAVVVRQTEGEVRGFLLLSTLSGATIADGDSTQVTQHHPVSRTPVICWAW